ncbi:MAG: S8 family peptidase [Flavobacteriales bacterium]
MSQVRATRRLAGPAPGPGKFTLLAEPPLVARGGQPEDYGPSWVQISMLNGHQLHALDAKGQGMLIGVLDSGFDRVDELAAFDDLRARGGIVLTADLAGHDGDVYDDHWHGRSVLSCMAGNVPGQLLGTAPSADYALVRTEEVAYELVIEEDNWVAGAELLDSLGCDVLNTSLGYTTFDAPEQDHGYADMDGATARISVAAGIAAQKGMIPVCSAGNSGSSPWYRIGAPADALDILAVGAVDAQGDAAGFSSRGPSYDGRVKPDVMAMGQGAIGLSVQGDTIAPLNGTSFSSPILAGLVACLWQLHPQRTAHDIMDAVRRSAHLWYMPNDSMGYGIPDFMQAHAWLTLTTSVDELSGASPVALPNPFDDQLSVTGLPADGAWDLALLDASGREVRSARAVAGGGMLRWTGLGGLAAGVYHLRVARGEESFVRRVMKP